MEVEIVEHSNDLGEFLRARRSLVSPADRGMTPGGARRVDGLRREEVALLAGVSKDYYTRLEQGRERRPSDQVLEALARVLGLDPVATEHLFGLALPTPKTSATLATTEVDDDLRHLIEHVIAAPACVVGCALNVLAANSLATALYSGFDRFDNLLRMVFLDPFATTFYDDWEAAAAGAVRTLRAQSAPFVNDPAVTSLVGDLTLHSPAFVALWSRHEVRPRSTETKRLHHPAVGALDLHYRSLSVTGAPGQHLFTYFAEAGSAAADALTLLARTSGVEYRTVAGAEYTEPSEGTSPSAGRRSG